MAHHSTPKSYKIFNQRRHISNQDMNRSYLPRAHPYETPPSANMVSTLLDPRKARSHTSRFITKLPRELRDEIYTHLLPGISRFDGKGTHSIFLVNKQITAEVQDLLRRSLLTVHVEPTDKLVALLRSGRLGSKINNRQIDFSVRIFEHEDPYRASITRRSWTAWLKFSLRNDLLTLVTNPGFGLYLTAPQLSRVLPRPVTKVIQALIPQRRIERTQVLLLGNPHYHSNVVLRVMRAEMECILAQAMWKGKMTLVWEKIRARNREAKE